MHAGAWMRANLTSQGYRLSDDERRALALGLRFSTGLCLLFVTVALALESSLMLFSLSAIGVVASVSARHPFDQLWNHAVRRILDAPALPPNPARRRDAFRLATVWLLVVGGLIAAGATTAGLVLGGMLVAVCAVVTTTNLCLPSETFAWWARRCARKQRAVI
jgi:hypothetical protein